MLGFALGLVLCATTVSPANAAPGDPSPTPTPTPTPTANPDPGQPQPPVPAPAPNTSSDPTTGPTPSASPSPSATPSASATPQADGGVVYKRGDKEFVVSGPILEHYTSLNREKGLLGFPTSNAFIGGRQLTVQQFEGGTIYWRADVGATHVWGAIADKYGQFGWEHGWMDVPVAGESRGRDNQSAYNRFRSGATIMWHPATGAHEVHGAIAEKWQSLDAEVGLGVPSTDEFAGNDGGRSRLNLFRSGGGGISTMVWNPPNGAHVVLGAIRDVWNGLGAEGGAALGSPTSDEFTPVRRDFRVSSFERGAVIWSARTGAQPVFGGLKDEYARRGWENGDLGAPTGREFRFANGWGQDFENGRLLLLDGAGYRTQVRTNPYVRLATPGDVSRTWRPGCPVGADQLRVVEMNHLGYDGRIKRGMMVLRADAVDRTVRAFSAGAWDSFPIEKMINPDVWGNDPDQMAANNTSGFFCRSVVGNPYSMSPHSYGRAVDINTVQNPYFDGSRWWPANGRPWIDRNRRDQGMLFNGGPMTRNMTDNGYFWGGWWASKDYQHFQIN